MTTSPTLGVMQVKIFVLEASTRKGEMRYDKLEQQINSWLRKNDVAVRDTTTITQPNESAGHAAVAVWYDWVEDEV